MSKITYKREKRETGLAGVGNPLPNVNIKLNKKEIGVICAPNWMTEDGKWSARLKVKKEATKESPCPWKWINIKLRWDSEEEARNWINVRAEEIAKLNLYTDD